MKKACAVIIAALSLLIGCGSNREYKMEMPNRMEEVAFRKDENKMVTISAVTFSNPGMDRVERAFGRSIKSIVQNEFSNNNFTVLAREELRAVMNEYYFNKEIRGIRDPPAFSGSNYTVNVKITNIGFDDTGILIPIVFNRLTHSIDISVEMTIIDNKTGQIIGSSGSGRVSYKTTNMLILIGDINVSYSIPLENALKLAVRDAILKARI